MMAGACGEAQSDRWSDLGVWEPDGVVRHGWARHDESGIIHLSPHCLLDGQEPGLHELQEVGGDEVSANLYRVV